MLDREFVQRVHSAGPPAWTLTTVLASSSCDHREMTPPLRLKTSPVTFAAASVHSHVIIGAMNSGTVR